MLYTEGLECLQHRQYLHWIVRNHFTFLILLNFKFFNVAPSQGCQRIFMYIFVKGFRTCYEREGRVFITVLTVILFQNKRHSSADKNSS